MFKVKRGLFFAIPLVFVLLVGALFPMAQNGAVRANAEEVKSFSVDYTKTGLVEGEYYSYKHVTTDKEGHADYGVIPASKWGAFVDLDDGEIVYKIQSEGDTLLKNVKLNFNAYFGCANQGEYWGASKTNIRVLVSKEAESGYIEVMNAHDGAKAQAFVKTTVTNPNGQSYNGKPITVGQTGVYGNYSVYSDYEIDLDKSGAVGMATVLYIKLQFVHKPYAELIKEWSADKINHLVSSKGVDLESEKLGLHLAGIRLLNLGISYTEEEISDEGKQVYGEDVEVDFNDGSDYSDLTKIAYDAAGVSVLGDNDGEEQTDYFINGENCKVSALAPNYTNSEGYLVFKFVAPEGQSFESLNITSIARLFDNNLAGVYEKLQFYVGTTMSNYQLVHSSMIEGYQGVSVSHPNGNCPVEQIDCDAYVFGRESFYVKVVVGCSGNRTWTNLKYLKFDVEYETVEISVFCGEKENGAIRVRRGAVLDTGAITMPDSFVRSDENYYSSKNFEESSIIDLTKPLPDGVKAVYIKGEWGYYGVSYELFGGVNATENAEKYQSEAGMQLFAPTKEGHLFVGWFTDEELTAPIDELAKGHTGNVTLYAKFIPDTPIDLGLDYTPPQKAGLTPLQIGLIVFSVVVVLGAGGTVGYFVWKKKRG